MPFTKADRAAGHAAMLTSPNFTKAQRVRKKFSPRRPLEKNRVLTPYQALLQTCLMADEVRTEMERLELDPSKDFFVGLFVRHSKEGVQRGQTILVNPVPNAIGEAFSELEGLRDCEPVGAIFQVIDREAKVETEGSRIWARPFLAGKKDLADLREAAERHAGRKQDA